MDKIYFQGKACSNDTKYYQVCDNRLPGYRVTNSDRLCGNWWCQSVRNSSWIFLQTQVEQVGLRCNGQQDCEDNLDETNCSAENATRFTTKLRSGLEITSSFICNDRCDHWDCEDEANCNGLSYGMYCKTTNPMDRTVNENTYLPTALRCNNFMECDSGEDEVNCSVTEGTVDTCRQFYSGKEVPVFNYTRCAVPDVIYSVLSDVAAGFSKYCIDADIKKYQTNCSDQFKIGLTCSVDGYLSSLSRYAICFNQTVSICDDKIESQCPAISKSCLNIHKHAMCDNNIDCADKSDESHQICRKQTKATCKRRVGSGGELRLPLTWIADGIRDCEDGSDEQDIWPTCGQDKTYRVVTSNNSCQNVYLCIWEDPGYVDLNDLCDGLETCGNENKVCSSSRSSKDLSTLVLSKQHGLMKHLSICLEGLQSIENLGQ